MKYSQFLKLMKQNCTPDRERIYKDILAQKTYSFFKVFAIICAVVLLLSAIGTGGYFAFNKIKGGDENHLPEELMELSPVTAIKATEIKGNAIMQNTAFDITTRDTCTADELYSVIEISPKTDFSIKKTSGNTFRINFDKHLNSDTLYKISSKIGQKTVYSWAFQTAKKFEITASSGGTKNCVSMFLTSEIWVEFSHSDVKNFEQYFSISPAVSGTFEQYGKRWVFIPSSDFSKNTVYTVTISKDIMNSDGQTLGKDYSFNVLSCVGNAYVDCLNSSNDCEIFSVGQIPKATFEYQNIDVSHAKVNVYRTSSASTFISIHKKYVKGGTVSSAIEEQFKGEPTFVFDATLNIDAQNKRAHLVYPEAFGVGFYIVQVVFGDCVTYHLFEVTEHSIYSNVSNGNITLWLNDPITQKGMEGITVADEYGNITITDSNGLAEIDCSDKTDLVYLNISTEKQSAVIVKPKQSKNTVTAINGNNIILTDKTSYRAGELVKLHGFAAFDEKEKDIDYQVKNSWSDEVVAIEPDTNGCFSAEFNSKLVASQSGYIDLVKNGDVVATTFIDIYSTNPKYFLDITTDKRMYVEGETVRYTVYATLTDGTPAENVIIGFDGKEYTTNSRGLATMTQKAVAENNKTVLSSFYCQAQPYTVEYDVVKSNIFISDVVIKDDGAADVFVKSVDGTPADCDVELETYLGDTLQGTTKVSTQNSVAKITFGTAAQNVHYVIKAQNDSYTYYPNNSQIIAAQYELLCKSEYSVGDKVTMTLFDTTTNTAVQNGKVLLNLQYNNTVKNIICDANNITFDFVKEYGDSISISGAYFTGARLHTTAETVISKKQTPLNIVTTFDKLNYSIGDTVNIEVDVLDKDGSPVSASLLVNVSDNMVCFAQKGANNKYLASPYFETVATDNGGHAKISFVLTNDITDWKVNILAVDQRQNTGYVKKIISVTSPMYIETFVSNEIFDSDDISFAFKLDGNGVDNTCNYTAVLLKDGIQIASKSGNANKGQIKNENFGKVDTTGSVYTIKISGTSGELSCEGEKNFKIVKRVNTHTSLTLQNRIHVDKDTYNNDIAISIYDPEYELYFKIIDKMLGKTSNRADHKLAYILANEIATGKPAKTSDLQTVASYATEQGIYIYNGHNIATVPQAALIAAVADDRFDKDVVKNYFTAILNGKPDTLNVIASNIVLASLGAPVLNELYNLYEAVETYTDEQKLFLALGFAYAGDYSTAYKVLNNGILDKIRTANGIATFEADTPVATDYMSCIAAILTSKLSQKNAKDLVKGVLNSADTTLSGLAYCEFVRNCCMHLESSNSVIFTDAEGKSHEIHYPRADHITINVAKEDINKIKIDDNVGENFSCIALTDSIENSKFSKTQNAITSISVPNGTINDGQTVTLTARINTTNSKMGPSYAVLKLPHGLKFSGATVTEGNAAITNAGDIYINKSSDIVTVQIICYAALEGKYTVVAPTIVDRDTKQTVDGNSVEVTIS